jgi:hypothetical protein
VRLADVPGAPEAGYEVKATLGSALSALFEEIRQDEAAGKKENAHWYGKETLQMLRDRKTNAPQRGRPKNKTAALREVTHAIPLSSMLQETARQAWKVRCPSCQVVMRLPHNKEWPCRTMYRRPN